MDTGSESIVATVDVGTVRDVHTPLQVDAVPTLVVFDKGQVTNLVKGCQTEARYASILTGRGIGSRMEIEGTRQPRVTVYTTPTCSWCTTLKTYLDQQGVRYREVNVATDQAAAEAMVKKSGQQGVPQTEINGQMIVGFDKNRLNSLLNIA
jgi:glutaredoxin-like YruB-family protein